MPLDPIVQSRFSKMERWCLLLSLLLLICAVSITAFMVNQYTDRFYPGVKLNGAEVNGKTKAEVKELLMTQENQLAPFSITLHVDDIQVASSSAELGGHYNQDEVIEKGFKVGRNQSFFTRVWRVISPWPSSVEFNMTYQLDQEKLNQLLSGLAAKVDIAPEEPSAILKFSQSAGSLKLLPGKSGRRVDQAETIKKISERLQTTDLHIPAPVASISAGLNPEQIAPAVERAKKFVGKKITLRADNVFQQVNDQLIINLLAFPEGISSTRLQPVVDELSKDVNRPPQNAEFAYDQNTLKVEKFVAPRKGLALDISQFEQELSHSIASLENSDEKEITFTLPVEETNPEKDLSKTNNLGVVERIGFGESQYAHSIPNRIHNVALTASRINNTLIKPGDEFSFNKTLGEVSQATGYRPAYVISGGRTVLGDGGGVCQVSTTTFRAVLNAGLPVTKRKAHSYRVSYYELNAKPGIDATVYAGDIDLRFINDTGHYILLHTQTNSEKLYMTVEIYGTSDGRTAQIVDHKTWDFVGAPAPLYIDDPTIPKGQIRQVDFAASGIKASFKNVIKDKNGKLIREEEYFSNYQPWRAVFLRGV